MRKLYTLLGAFLLLVSTNVGWAQNATYKGALIYQITRYIEWEAASDPFSIQVVGESDILPVLESIAAKKMVGDRKIEVKKVAPASVGGADIVFVPEQQELGSILSTVSGKKTLVVTESPGAAQKGAGINFVNSGGKIQIEMNKTQMVKTGLKPSLSLERLAVKVL